MYTELVVEEMGEQLRAAPARRDVASRVISGASVLWVELDHFLGK